MVGVVDEGAQFFGKSNNIDFQFAAVPEVGGGCVKDGGAVRSSHRSLPSDGGGGPMKALIGCRRMEDIPKELFMVYGGQEFKLAVAIRDLYGGVERGGEHKKESGNDERKGRTMVVEEERSHALENGRKLGKGTREDAGSSSAPEKTGKRKATDPIWEITNLGEASSTMTKDESRLPSSAEKVNGSMNQSGAEVG